MRIPTRIALFLAVVAWALASCSKDESPAQKAKPIARAEQAPSVTASKEPEIDPALKERLARQEAAARMFEKNVLEPTPPKAAAPAPAPKTAPAAQPAPAEVKPEPKPETKPEPPRPQPQPQARAEPPPAPAAAPPKPAPAPAKSEPAARTDLAAAKPSAAAAAPVAPRLVSRVDPDFPREAVQAGVDRGTVRARMTLDETGSVTRVEVVDATPRRVFDRAVVRALSQWRYNDGAAGRTVEAEIDFKR